MIINKEENYIIEHENIGNNLYFYNEDLNIKINLENDENGYKFNYEKYSVLFFEYLYFKADNLELQLMSQNQNTSFNILLQSIKSKDNRLVFTMFNNEYGTVFNISLSVQYKNLLQNYSQKAYRFLKDIKCDITNVCSENNSYLLDLDLHNNDYANINIDDFLFSKINYHIPLKIELVCEKKEKIIIEDNCYEESNEEIIINACNEEIPNSELDECEIEKEIFEFTPVYSKEIIYKNETYNTLLDLKHVCQQENEKGTYVISINIKIYNFEKKIVVQNSLTNINNIDEISLIPLIQGKNLKAGLNFDNEYGLQLNISEAKYIADIIDIEVNEKNTVFSVKINNEIEPVNDLSSDNKVYLSIIKRNSSICHNFDNIGINNNIVFFNLDNEEVMNHTYSGLWDIHINLIINNALVSLKVHNSSEIENKKNTLTFPYIMDKMNNKAIKLYYTLDDNLAFEVDEKIKVSKVNALTLTDGTINISGVLSVISGIDINEGKIKDNLIICWENLDEKYIPAEIVIKKSSLNTYKFNISTEKIQDIEQLENVIYTKKFFFILNKARLSINVDYSNIYIEKIDSNIKNNDYKLFVKIAYKIMCKILPIKTNLLFFQSFGGRSYSGNPKYMYEYIKDDSSYKCVWGLRNQFEYVPGKAKKVKVDSLMYYYYLARAEYIISNLNMQTHIKKRKKAKFIQTWHGTPLKRISFDVPKNSPGYDKKFLKGFAKRVKKWDGLLAQNKFSIEKFKSAFRYEGPIYETGHPLNDILVENSNEKIKSIKEKLKIDKNKKVILYAPTWRENSRFVLDLDIDKLRYKLKDDYVLLIKTHYFVNTSVDVEKYKGFVYDVSKYEDIQELALISDVLVTDYSSVMFDFAATKRPIIFYCHDLEYYKGKLRGFYFDFENEAPGPIAFTSEQVGEFIVNIKAIKEEYCEKYKAFYEKYAYMEDGNSSRRACELLLNERIKNKKIYFLSFNIFGMGGTGRTVINTAEYLANNGYDVELISVFGNKNDKYFNIDEKIKITVLDGKGIKKTRFERLLKTRKSKLIDRDDEFYHNFSMLTDYKLLKTLFKINKGIVVSTRPGFNIMIAKYFKIRRFKVIGQEHLNFNIHTEKLQKSIKKYYKKLDLLMTLTDADTKGYLEQIPTMKNKIIKVPNAIPNLRSFEEMERNKDIIAAGRLVPQKGFDLLIEAAPKILQKHPDWKIKIFGKGRDEKYLKDLINEHGLQGKVLLMGPSKEIEKEMAQGGIYVLSSRYEGFGMVIVEAMQMGLPVVSFDCPEGPREIIKDGYDGILVTNGDLDGLASSINMLIENPKLREELAENAKCRVKRFNMANIGSIWNECLRKLY